EHGDASDHRVAFSAPVTAPGRDPMRRSVPLRMRRRFARCRNRMSDPLPTAAATTDPGAPESSAADGSVTVAARDPSEMTRDVQTTIRNTAAAAIVATGARIANTPAATATPFPP